jgi:N-acetylmuramoyl-L-alanine amidase
MKEGSNLRLVALMATVLAATSVAAGVTDNLHYTVPEGEPLAGWRICVDAGHGGQTWGAARGYTGGTRSAVSDLTESDVNLRVAMFLWDLLTQAGADVVMTRTYETRLSADVQDEPGSQGWRAGRDAELGIRREVAKANDCDFMVMVHHNAAGPDANFSTAFYFDPEQQAAEGGEPSPEPHSPESVAFARDLAQSILDEFEEWLDIGTRPVRHRENHVMRTSTVPAVVLEASFMTNRDEAERLDYLGYNRREAIAIFEGILDHCTAMRASQEATE